MLTFTAHRGTLLILSHRVIIIIVADVRYTAARSTDLLDLIGSGQPPPPTPRCFPRRPTLLVTALMARVGEAPPDMTQSTLRDSDSRL